MRQQLKSTDQKTKKYNPPPPPPPPPHSRQPNQIKAELLFDQSHVWRSAASRQAGICTRKPANDPPSSFAVKPPLPHTPACRAPSAHGASRPLKPLYLSEDRPNDGRQLSQPSPRSSFPYSASSSATSHSIKQSAQNFPSYPRNDRQLAQVNTQEGSTRTAANASTDFLGHVSSIGTIKTQPSMHPSFGPAEQPSRRHTPQHHMAKKPATRGCTPKDFSPQRHQRAESPRRMGEMESAPSFYNEARKPDFTAGNPFTQAENPFISNRPYLKADRGGNQYVNYHNNFNQFYIQPPPQQYSSAPPPSYMPFGSEFSQRGEGFNESAVYRQQPSLESLKESEMNFSARSSKEEFSHLTNALNGLQSIFDFTSMNDSFEQQERTRRAAPSSREFISSLAQLQPQPSSRTDDLYEPRFEAGYQAGEQRGRRSHAGDKFGHDRDGAKQPYGVPGAFGGQYDAFRGGLAKEESVKREFAGSGRGWLCVARDGEKPVVKPGGAGWNMAQTFERIKSDNYMFLDHIKKSDPDLFKKSGRSILPGRRRPRKMFSDEEVHNLIKGVERFGEGKWARILQCFGFDDRTAVDLKDKWRNLQKPSSTVKVPKGRRTRLPYTDIECRQLRYGVEVFGHNWVAILRAFTFNSERTPVDLKDKWRNLQIKHGKIDPPTKNSRRFLLLDSENQIFGSVYPRDAALKAASRGFDYIKLLQIGTPRIHVFAGERRLVHRYIGRERGTLWKGRVLKLGMERATVALLRVAKIRYAAQYGVKAAHEIAPNVEVDPNNVSGEEIKMKDIFTSKIDKEVIHELRTSKDNDFFKDENDSLYESENGEYFEGQDEFCFDSQLANDLREIDF